MANLILVAGMFLMAFASTATASYWFRRIGWIKNLRAKANEVDKETVIVPNNQLTIKQMRSHRKCGVKIVITHGLVRMVDDVERIISRTIVGGAIVTLVFQTAVAFYTISSVAKSAKAQETAVDILQKVADRTLDIYMGPIYAILLALSYSLVIFLFIEEQVNKYKDGFELDSV